MSLPGLHASAIRTAERPRHGTRPRGGGANVLVRPQGFDSAASGIAVPCVLSGGERVRSTLSHPACSPTRWTLQSPRILPQLGCLAGSPQGIFLGSATLARGFGVWRQLFIFSQKRRESWVSRSQDAVGGNWVAKSVGCDRRFATVRASSPTLCGAAAGLCRQRVGNGGTAPRRWRAPVVVAQLIVAPASRIVAPATRVTRYTRKPP